MIFLQGKPVFYTFLPSTSPLLTDNFVEMDTSVAAKAKVGHLTSFGRSWVLSLPYETYLRSLYFGTL